MNATNNPYSPPKSDPGSGPEIARPPRPRAVDIALVLLVIEVLYLAFDVFGSLNLVNNGSMSALWLLLQLIYLGLLAWACYALARGRNWARYLLLVLAAWALLSLIAAFPALRRLGTYGFGYQNTARQLFMLALPTLLSVTACYLVFIPAREWFARRS